MDTGSYVWLIGLGGGTVLLGLVIGYGLMRGRRSTAAGNSNAAWQQAADESGHPEVAQAPVQGGGSKVRRAGE